MDAADPLALFLPPVQRWFRSALGEPTAAQRLGWPAIAAGQNTLILAPTGSGKTLAALRSYGYTPAASIMLDTPLAEH
jgi:Lhr-like helicase